MKILLTGATGYIGSRVLAHLIESGHEVTAVVRNQAAALKATDAGAVALIGDLYDASWLGEELPHYSGAIHTAASSDDPAALNDAVIDAAITAYAGTENPFVLTGGVWSYGNGDHITEESPIDAPPISAWRAAGEARLLESGVKASVIEPGIVYGRGAGIAAILAGGTSDDGSLTLIGSGDQHWTTVHVDDLADLYVAVLEQAPGGHKYLGVSGVNPTVRELGEAVSSDVSPETAEQTVGRFGEAFGTALLLDQQASGDASRHAFGWDPSRPTLVELLAKGYPADE